MNLQYRRELALDASRADSTRRSVPAVISSTFPVQRNGFTEVLLHGPDNVNLTRAPLPLIESHDGGEVNIGLVENLRLTGDKLRGEIVFGTSNRANELWPDIQAGIVRHLSVGYTIDDYRTSGDTMQVTRWTPHEASLVSIPADPTVGLNRSFSMNEHNEGLPAADAGEPRLSRSQRRALNEPSESMRSFFADRERRESIAEIANGYKRYDLGDLAERCMRDGSSVEVFRNLALQKMQTRPIATAGGNFGSMPGAGGQRRFSAARALAAMIDPRSVDAGYELEVSQEIAMQTGRKARGIYMPLGTMQNRTLAVGGGSALVGVEQMGGEFIDILRARSVVMGLGPMVLTGLSQNASIPRLTASATASWIAGDGADAITDSTPTFDAVTLSPKTLGGLVLLSRKMVLQSSPDAENLVLNDLGQVIATALDKAAIAGTGATNQPTGVLSTSGIATSTFAAAAPTFAEIVAMESALTGANADASSAAYVTTPALAGVMKTTLKASYAAEMLWEASDTAGIGEVNGLRAFASSNVPAGKVILGNWSDFIVGFWGGVDLEINPYEDFSKGVVSVRCIVSVDFGVRHPASFAAYSTP